MKYLKPEMDIVEFDESVLTDINLNSEETNLDNGSTDIPPISGGTN